MLSARVLQILGKRSLTYYKQSATYTVVFVRHGESEWNHKNLFTGWYDAPLTEKGKEEALNASRALTRENMDFDVAFTSMLSRAQKTLELILCRSKQPVEVVKSWRLNERHYGGLTGLNKAATAKRFGTEKVTQWRRSYDVAPPPMNSSHPLYQEIVNPLRYGNDQHTHFPKTESLKMTLHRLKPYWCHTIVPEIKSGRRVIVVAHGNSLRAILKSIDNIPDDEIVSLNIPTGVPFSYTFDKWMRPMASKRMQFYGTYATVEAAKRATHYP